MSVGDAVPHESARGHVTGDALYTDDLLGRFPDLLHAWPVLAPLLSSVAVIATYLTYRVTAPKDDIPHVREGSWLILAVGTTLGVVVLSLYLILPVARLGLRWRPTLRFTGDARRTVGGLAGVAIVTVAAQQIALFIAVRLVPGDRPAT